jgi:DNA-directed RNA polymerase specialized sigma subunit
MNSADAFARTPHPQRHAIHRAQLAAVLAACQTRDQLREPGIAASQKRQLSREYHQRLMTVEDVFSDVARTLLRRFIGNDYTGRPILKEDLKQAVSLGVAEAVHRYDVSKGARGAAFYVEKRILWALQQLTGSTRAKRRVISLCSGPIL